MTNPRQLGLFLALAMTGALLQGCESPKPPEAAKPGPRLFAADVTGGAKACTVPKVLPARGKSVDAAMTVGNDGGWCAITVTQPGGAPFDAGLLRALGGVCIELRHGLVEPSAGGQVLGHIESRRRGSLGGITGLGRICRSLCASRSGN